MRYPQRLYDALRIYALGQRLDIENRYLLLYAHVHCLTDGGTKGEESLDLGEGKTLDGVINDILGPFRFPPFNKVTEHPLVAQSLKDVRQVLTDRKFRARIFEDYKTKILPRLKRYGTMDFMSALFERFGSGVKK